MEPTRRWSSEKSDTKQSRAVQFPDLIELHRSRRFDIAVLTVHLLATGCVLVAPWPFWLLIPVLGFSVFRIVGYRRFSALQPTAKGDLLCFYPDGTSGDFAVLPDSTVFRYLVVLRLYSEQTGRASHLVLFPDQMSTKAFRRLTIWLCWMVRRDEKASV